MLASHYMYTTIITRPMHILKCETCSLHKCSLIHNRGKQNKWQDLVYTYQSFPSVNVQTKRFNCLWIYHVHVILSVQYSHFLWMKALPSVLPHPAYHVEPWTFAIVPCMAGTSAELFCWRRQLFWQQRVQTTPQTSGGKPRHRRPER